jgi:uncharacterized protein DUF6011
VSAGAKLEAEQIKPYTMAGNSTVTLVSVVTGARFTFKVRKAPKTPHGTAPDTWFVKVLAGSDNTADYRYIGYIREGRFVHGAGKSFAKLDAPSVIAFAWFARQVLFPSANGTPRADRLEVWHEGACGRCGRKLTVPESIATGLGPECASKGGFGALIRHKLAS